MDLIEQLPSSAMRVESCFVGGGSRKAPEHRERWWAFIQASDDIDPDAISGWDDKLVADAYILCGKELFNRKKDGQAPVEISSDDDDPPRAVVRKTRKRTKTVIEDTDDDGSGGFSDEETLVEQ